MQLLEELQGLLQQTYDLPGEHRVTDFLTMNPAVIEALGIAPESAGAREQVLVSQQDDSVDVALYIAPEVLARLSDSDPLECLHDGNISDFWLALEGVSHFVYLACTLERFRRRRDLAPLTPELRRFYRMNQRAKLARIAREGQVGGAR